MHELSLCHSIYTIADRARDGRSVEVVALRVGWLRQVVPQTLEYCWGMVTESTPLAGSTLRIVQVPVTLRCRTCAALTELGEDIDLTCAGCGARQVEIVAGDEFTLDFLELAGSDDRTTAGVEPHG